jgi:glucose-1-phosphate cytidylyltransferase
MQVMILCGGMGTRLREHTQTLPKPMVEIGGRPILWHIMKLYAHHGVREFILCLGYKGEVIKRYFLNYEAMNNDFTLELGQRGAIRYHGAESGMEDWTVTLADTGEDAMTGARLKRAARYLKGGETFAVTYGDGVSDLDLTAALAFHKAHGGLATVTGVRPPNRFGELKVEGSKVVAFEEKPQVGQGMINGGFFFLEPGFLDYLSEESSCVLEKQPLERCAADGRLRVYEHGGYWQCMDTYRDWKSLDEQWRAGAPPWKVWR